jgi:hypothetical protein
MKLVKETLYEFERSDNSLKNLGIGKRLLIEKWLAEMGIRWYTINDDFTINKHHSANLGDGIYIRLKKLKGNLPDYIVFNETGPFDISGCELTTLRGCPRIVHGFFNCKGNRLTSLDYCPKYVSDQFICYDNNREFDREEILQICKCNGTIFHAF